MKPYQARHLYLSGESSLKLVALPDPLGGPLTYSELWAGKDLVNGRRLPMSGSRSDSQKLSDQNDRHGAGMPLTPTLHRRKSKID
jgi:hypothetical protein